MKHFLKNKINYAGIDWESTLNGTGTRVVLYLQGCEHHCEHCHNKTTWNPKLGTMLTVQELKQIITTVNEGELLTGVTLSGGDPFFNQQALLEILIYLKENLDPKKNIWCYTGYTYEELEGFGLQKQLKLIDVLVDGKYVKELNTNNHKFRGSGNQRILKLKDGKICGE